MTDTLELVYLNKSSKDRRENQEVGWRQGGVVGHTVMGRGWMQGGVSRVRRGKCEQGNHSFKSRTNNHWPLTRVQSPVIISILLFVILSFWYWKRKALLSCNLRLEKPNATYLQLCELTLATSSIPKNQCLCSAWDLWEDPAARWSLNNCVMMKIREAADAFISSKTVVWAFTMYKQVQ